ncbi:OsmC family protein [Achromobacter pestifer]|uniref:OsmC family protein n=1 Tax=Achromobacter pestifer TaxID=1353889 RepID=UPI0020B63FD1|nr:hypothetical protein [Achromobacter pestifer]
MAEDSQRGGAFTLVNLRPEVIIRGGDDAALAAELHDRAHHFCFIANSVNFPIRCELRIAYAQQIPSPTTRPTEAWSASGQKRP